MGLHSIEEGSRQGRLLCYRYGHLQCMDPTAWPKETPATTGGWEEPKGSTQEDMIGVCEERHTGERSVDDTCPES